MKLTMNPLSSIKAFVVLFASAVLGFLAPAVATAQTNPPAASLEPSEAIARIKDQGLTTNSRVMATLSYLSDVIGQRLTGSPNLKRANEWTKMKLESWGLNAHLEAWGPFGRGWELKHFSAQIVEPQVFPLIACPQAWSPGLSRPLTARVVYLGALTTSNLDSYKGKLRDAIVLASPMHEIALHFDPLAARQSESNLTHLAGLTGNADRNRDRGGPGRRRGQFNTNRVSPGRLMAFLQKEKVGVVVNESPEGDGGTVFVASATAPSTNTTATVSNSNAPGTNGNFRGGGFGARGPSAYALNAPAMPPQITLAAEDYNRLVRMLQQGVPLKMEVDLKVKFHSEDPMAYNTIAEIPGTDLKDQIVMMGGHLDSWQAGTGATDNGAGVAVAMEAARIIEAAHLHPRRTIRVALWSGEEEGLLGSRAYVSNHFGSYGTNGPPGRGRRLRDSTPAEGADTAAEDTANTTATATATNQSARHPLLRGPEYDKLSVYFNLDNGAGKIRGVYMQGNAAVRPLFTKWLEPFHSLGAETITVSGTGSTDHISFDSIGLPGFEFLQDPLEYMTRSHHSNEDVFDRIQAEDLKQAATILAAFAYDAAMIDEKLPRKPLAE